MTPLLWCRDSVSCLQSTAADALHRAGVDPLEALGAGWEFTYLPGDVTTEEFYLPAPDGDLGRALCPHHPVTIRWHRPPPDDPDPLRALRDRLAAGRRPIAAVDNFHLPFRPAFHDVHAAHLLVVFGIDDDAGRVLVSDAMPPSFQGAIARDDFLASWSSHNPADPQGDFFSSRRIDRRWLEVDVAPDVPALTPATLTAAITTNTRRYAEPPAGVGWRGRVGLARWSADLLARAAAGEEAALTETYVLGWSAQAQSDLHAALLLDRGRRWDRPELAEAGRLVQRAAHAWTGVRVTAAHGRADPARAAAPLGRHLARLRTAYESAHDSLDALAHQAN